MEQSAKTYLYLTLSLCLAMTGIAFEMLFFHELDFAWQNVCAWSVALLIIALWGIFAYAFFKERETIYKTILTIFIFFDLCSILLFVFYKTGFLYLLRDRELLQSYIRETGVWAPCVFMLLQFLQTIVLPIPTALTVAIGVYLFGAWKCLLYSFVGCVLGSIVAFYIGRKLGFRAVAWLFGEDTVKEWLKKIKGKDSFILTAMFLLPFFPDDLLCFVAGLSSMSDRYFLGMICLSRIVSISTTAFPVDLIPFNTWWGLLLWGLIFTIVIVLMYFAYKKQDEIYSFLRKIGKKK